MGSVLQACCFFFEMLPIETWAPPLKSELCDFFSLLSGGNDVLGLLRPGHKRPGPCAHSSWSAGSLVASGSQKESLTLPQEGPRVPSGCSPLPGQASGPVGPASSQA